MIPDTLHINASTRHSKKMVITSTSGSARRTEQKDTCCYCCLVLNPHLIVQCARHFLRTMVIYGPSAHHDQHWHPGMAFINATKQKQLNLQIWVSKHLWIHSSWKPRNEVRACWIYGIPWDPCMVYLPTFTPLNYPVLKVNLPYIKRLGIVQLL